MTWQEFSSSLRPFSPSERERVRAAYELAQGKHAGQQRLSGDEYFSHPIATALLLSGLNADADTIAAALLHDTVEDTDLTLAEIRHTCGADVADLVEGVTKLSADELHHGIHTNEHIETLRKIFTLMQHDIRIMIIKLCDRLHNMQTASFLTEEKRRDMAEETLDVCVKIADRLCMQEIRDTLEGLCLSILEPTVHATLIEQSRASASLHQDALTLIRYRLQNDGASSAQRNLPSLFSESQTWGQRLTHLQRSHAAITGTASLTVVFVCEDRDDCYRILGVLHRLWIREALSFQDYINAPTINGYRGLHTTIILDDGTRVRCKIRTREMHTYAHNGIASICFREAHADVSAFLPWTKSISSLSHTTAGRSDAFWESLRSDILGESIIIYGSSDEVAQLPSHATALDGAFFLFQERALQCQAILVNGMRTPFSQPLQYADTLAIVPAEQTTVSRQWLECVHTGFALSAIRTALGSLQTREEQITAGKAMLQDMMTKKKRGFIDELHERQFQAIVTGYGYDNISDVYVALSEGSLNVHDIFSVIFSQLSSAAEQRHTVVVRYVTKIQDSAAVHHMSRVYQQYQDTLVEMRQKRLAHTSFSSTTVIISLTFKEQQQLRKMLQAAGATNVDIIHRSKKTTLLIGAIIFLWALNPVFAKWFLLHGFLASSLITLRLLTLAVFNIAYFCFWRMRTKHAALAPIPHLRSLSLLPSLGLISLTFFNYLGLIWLAPSVHLTLLRFNTLLLPTLAFTTLHAHRKRPLGIFVLLLLSIIVLFIVTLGTHVLPGILLSCLALMSYTFYSMSTEHILAKYKIGLRYPYFLLSSGMVIGLFGLSMIPFQSFSTLFNALTLPAIIYVACCVALPHALYTIVLQSMRFRHFSDLLIMEIPLAMLLEALILRTSLPLLTYAVIGISVGLLMYVRRRMIILPVDMRQSDI